MKSVKPARGAWSDGPLVNIGLAAICIVSLALWLDIISALWELLFRAAKSSPGVPHWPIGEIRPVRVIVCLTWGVALLLGWQLCAPAGVLRLLSLLAASLIILTGVSLMELNVFAIPVLPQLIGYAGFVATVFLIKFFAGVLLAQALLVSRLKTTRYRSAVSAVVLACCSQMLLVGLFYLLYPGVVWRQ